MTVRAGVAGACVLTVALGACASSSARAVKRDARALGRAVGHGDVTAIEGALISPQQIDTAALLKGRERRKWSKRLAQPLEVHPYAWMRVPVVGVLRVEQTDDGWRLTEDPTQLYRQSTPRQALRAFVLATQMQRWDVLVGLAPAQFRMGLTPQDLERAWTEGDYAQVLRAARDEVAAHLWMPIDEDAHDAVLTISEHHVVRLEREGDRWVVADFMPREPVQP